MQVPYTNFNYKNKPIKREILEAFEKVLDSGHYIQGPEVNEFENEFANYCNVSFATGISNGTCSSLLAFKSLNIGEGDEVITAPNSFIASASSIALAGAKPVFADINDDLNINPLEIEKNITNKTKAVVPVHLTGRPANMDMINEIAKKYKLFVLEDAAQSVGAKYKGKKVGSFGDAASFSLHPLKNLHAYGDAGIFVTKHSYLIEKMKIIKNHGLMSRDHCEIWGHNCKLDEVQAALLRIQLRNLDLWTKERRDLAIRYNQKLKSYVKVPEENLEEYHVYQTYVVLAEKRNELQTFLRTHGVEAIVHYPTPIHMQPAAKYLDLDPKDFPKTLGMSNMILSLPLYPGLSTAQQDYVIDLFKKFYS